jgi:hypothetical protein
MTDYKKLLLEAVATPLGFDDEIELLEALAEIVANWEKIGKIDGIDSIEDLLKHLAGDLDSDAIKTAFAAAGLSGLHATLVTYVGKLVKLVGGVPESYRLLLQKVGAFDEVDDASKDKGKVAWTLLQESKDFGDAERFTVGVSGKASIELEAGGSWFYPGEPMPDPLLRLSASGTAGVKGSGKLASPFKPISAELGASGDATVNLHYYFEADPGELYALAVAKRIPQLPDPFEFDAVWGAFGETDLAGLVYHFEGAATAHVGVSLGDTLKLGQGIAVKLAADVNVAVGIKGNYELAFRAGKQGDARVLRATLTRGRTTTESLALSLGLTVDLSALASRVHTELKKLLDQWDKALAGIRPFLSPGTWLQEHAATQLGDAAKALIADETLRAAVERDLRGLIGIETSSDLALAGWLNDKIAGAFDQVSGAVTKQIDDATNAVLDRLGDALPALAQADIRPKLETRVRALVTAAEAKYVDAVKAMLAVHTPKEVGDALKKAGAAVNGVVGELDAALKGVRDIVDKYDKLLHDTVDSFADAAKAQVSAEIQRQETYSSGAEYLITGTITSDAGRRAFEAMAHGRMGDLQPLFEHPEQFPGFTLDPAASSLARFASRESKTGFALVLFGIAFDWQTVIKSDAKILVDGAGTVHANTSGEIRKIFSGPDESREIAFVDVHSVVLAKAQVAAGGGGERSIELGLSVVQRDEKARRSEIVGFLDSLEQAPGALLPGGTSARAGTLFTAWSAGLPKDQLVADIAAKLWLDAAGARRLMRLDERRAARDAGKPDWNAAMGIDVIAKGYDALIRNGNQALMTSRFNQGLGLVMDEIGSTYNGIKLVELLYRFKDISDGTPQRYQDHNIPFDFNNLVIHGADERTRVDYFKEVQSMLRSLADAVRLMGDIYNATPKAAGGDWDETMYRNAQSDLARYTHGWLKLNTKFVLWFADGVHPRTRALMQVLLALAGDTRPDPVTVVLTNRTKDKPITVALVDQSKGS